MKNEVSYFIEKYILNRGIKKIQGLKYNYLNNLNKMIDNAKDFERPDGYSLLDDECYLIEHFEFDASVQDEKFSSQLRKKEAMLDKEATKILNCKIKESTDAQNCFMNNSNIAVNVSKDTYIKNLLRVFEEHSDNYIEYIDNLNGKGIKRDKFNLCFFIEDKTILGAYYDTGDPFVILTTKEFVDVWKAHENVKMIFFAIEGNGKRECYYVERESFIELEFPSINDVNLLITNSAQVLSMAIKIKTN